MGILTIVDFLNKKGYDVPANPNTKVSPEIYDILVKEYSSDITAKKESERLNLYGLQEKKESVSISDMESERGESGEEEVLIMDTARAGEPEAGQKEEGTAEETEEEELEEKEETAGEKEKKPAAKTAEEDKTKSADKESADKEKEQAEEEKKAVEGKKAEKDIKVVGKIDLDSGVQEKTGPEAKKAGKKEEPEKKETETTPPGEAEKKTEEKHGPAKEEDFIKRDVARLSGPTVVGKIDLPAGREGEGGEERKRKKKKKRKRIKRDTERVDISDRDEQGRKTGRKTGKKRKRNQKHEVDEEDVQKQIKDTLARLTSKGKSKASKYRREKREAQSQKTEEQAMQAAEEKHTLRVTEFVSVSELASMMDVTPTEVIGKCMDIGLFMSINQRMDAETIALIADEFGYKVEFISVDVQETIDEEIDKPEDLKPRSPIVTVMGHVDHGKTKLLDHIRKANVIAGEAGGITQHIGAYSVSLDGGRQITFLDTPGHEAFTAMRARGAQVTDIAIIVVAADDGVMPQTVEAINHAHAAGVPMVFAINKIDKPAANVDKIKEQLSNLNFATEDWGGKYQSQEISAKNGINIDELLEKVLLEAEMLELKANYNKRATGTVIESTLDRGRGYVVTILVESGTLRTGEVILAGAYSGHVKAMYNERGKKINEAGPATPVLILGLNGAPQAGDRFNIMESDREAKEIANKREQLQREQGLRSQKHVTLDEIGRRIAIGNFQELNIIVKGDVDGSIQALSDSLLKLSTEEIQVSVIHKAVGQITETDVMLAAASNAIIVGFQVRPSLNARKLAEKEQIDIRLYSVIYDAIEQVKSAMEGMLSPEIKEEVTATLEVKETFKISRTGTVAGCMVKEGKIKRTSKVRVIRDGIVVYTGELGSLKRFKDDAKEVAAGLECGLNIENFNDIKTGDVIEAFHEIEVKKKL